MSPERVILTITAVMALIMVPTAIAVAIIIIRKKLRPLIRLPKLQIKCNKEKLWWIIGIAVTVTLTILTYKSQWFVFKVVAAVFLLVIAMIKKGDFIAGLIGATIVIASAIAGLIWFSHNLNKDGPPLPSATDPTQFLYTMTETNSEDKIVGTAIFVRMTESSKAAISFQFTENRGGICEFTQRLGPAGEVGHWAGPQNGKGTFRVTEFLPGKVSVVRGNIWYEKSGYGNMPTGENHMNYFVLTPSGHK